MKYLLSILLLAANARADIFNYFNFTNLPPTVNVPVDIQGSTFNVTNNNYFGDTYLSNSISVAGVVVNITNLIDQSVHNPTAYQTIAGPFTSLNGSTAPVQVIEALSGLHVSNRLSPDGLTNYIGVGFGEVAPLVPTNLTGWNRFVYTQALAGASAATSVTFRVTESNGVEFVFKGWSGAGSSPSYYGGAGGYGYLYGRAPSGDVITLMVGQAGNYRSTGGVWRAFPDGGLSTNVTTAQGCGGGSTRMYINGSLAIIVGGGGGGGTATSQVGGPGGKTGASALGAGAGTGATQSAGGLTGGSALAGGNGPGAGGGGGYYGGGAGQVAGGAGGGGSSWYDDTYVGILYAAMAAGQASPANGTDPDYVSPWGAGGNAVNGSSGGIVLHTRAIP